MKKSDILFLNMIGVSSKRIFEIENTIPDFSDFDESKKRNILSSILSRSSQKLLYRHDETSFKRYCERLKQLNVNICFYNNSDYPERLQHIDDPPILLYYQGKQSDKDHLAISIVGSRKSTAYGRSVCTYFVTELAKLGITTISGLAYGIDSIVHEASIKEGGRTIGVLGNGIDQIYPAKNRMLYEQVKEQGLIFSEFPLGARPVAYHFPMRNRIISGLGLGLLVIEAKEKSGTLITANFAAEQGKDIFAVPGNINHPNSKGTNQLIQDGAKLVIDVDDLLNEISELKTLSTKREEIKPELSLSKDEELIFNMIRLCPMTSDELVEKTGLDIVTLNPYLTILEMKGLIQSDSGNRFICSI